MIRYTDELCDPTLLMSLFETTGWNAKYKLTTEELHQAFEQSWYHTFAYDGERLVASGRVICDGVVHALILDVIVHPSLQTQGVGREIMQRIIAHCRHQKIRDIQLFSARDKAGFYNKLGFRERPLNAPGMEYA